MDKDLKERTKKFALRVIKLVRSLPREVACDTIGRQLLRAGTSVAANYRAACRARSKTEFLAKMGIVEEEADETVFWMELLVDAEIVSASKMKNLLAEGNELVAIAVSSKRTARSRANKEYL